MSENSDEPQIGQREGGRQFGMALLAGLAIVLVLAGGAYFLVEKTATKPVEQAPPLPMGAEEQAYAQKIQFGNFDLTRTTNFLNQQVTYVTGVVTNHGARNVIEMEVSLEFRDIAQNVILRDKKRMFGSNERPLQSLEARDFQISYETVPDGWNQSPPAFTITGLKLQ
jgi:hypothetical protein